MVDVVLAGWTNEDVEERKRVHDYLSAELTPEPIELPKHGIKPPSFWRGSPDGGIDITSVDALASALGGRR